MDLKTQIKVLKCQFKAIENYVVSSMKSVESEDMPHDSELFADYNTLGFILASVRDLLKELEDYESTDNV